MRVTVRKFPLRTYRVWLDGVEQEVCTFADDVIGEVHRYKRNDDGTFVIDFDRIATEEVRGEVVIEAGPIEWGVIWNYLLAKMHIAALRFEVAWLLWKRRAMKALGL